MKRVFSFEMKREHATTMGDYWKAVGFVRGVCLFADGIFYGYTKKDIARILKNKILLQVNN